MASDDEKDPPWISHRLPDGTPVGKPRPITPDNSRPTQGWMTRIGYVSGSAKAVLDAGMTGSISLFRSPSSIPDPEPVWVKIEE